AEDRDAPLSLERDALVELGVRVGGRGGHRERAERLDLLRPPDPRRARVDGEHTVEPGVGALEWDSEVRVVTRRQERLVGRRPRVACEIRDGYRFAGSKHLGRRPASAAATSLEQFRALASRSRLYDEFVLIDELDRARVGVEQRRRLRGDLAQDGRRLQLRAEAASDRRKLLRQGARPPLGLEQLAALERGAGRAGELSGELDLV